jgi:hypothetical protein
MKQKLAILMAIVCWATLITQFVLMLQTFLLTKPEITIRFFSYFTILTNTLVAIYYSLVVFKKGTSSIATPTVVYITIVGLVYQLLLRATWSPTGLQMLVDELLHSVIPAATVVYWYAFERSSSIKYSQITKWLLYPLLYLVFILVRGHYAGFYPYPFVHVENLGMQQVLINSGVLMLVFIGFSAAYVWLNNRQHKATT